MKSYRYVFIFGIFSLIAACSDNGTQTGVSGQAEESAQNNQTVVENEAFYLAENGVTIICSDAEVGEQGTVEEVTYTKRSRDQITTSNAATTCTSGITDMSGLFEDAERFNEDISSWDVSSVTDMSGMFLGARAFNQHICKWDVSNVTDMSEMFEGTNFFNDIIGSWDVSSVTDMSSMFNTSDFNKPIGS